MLKELLPSLFVWGRLPIINQSSIRNGLFMYTIHVLQSTLVASRLFMLQLSTEAKKSPETAQAGL